MMPSADRRQCVEGGRGRGGTSRHRPRPCRTGRRDGSAARGRRGPRERAPGFQGTARPGSRADPRTGPRLERGCDAIALVGIPTGRGRPASGRTSPGSARPAQRPRFDFQHGGLGAAGVAMQEHLAVDVAKAERGRAVIMARAFGEEAAAAAIAAERGCDRLRVEIGMRGHLLGLRGPAFAEEADVLWERCLSRRPFLRRRRGAPFRVRRLLVTTAGGVLTPRPVWQFPKCLLRVKARPYGRFGKLRLDLRQTDTPEGRERAGVWTRRRRGRRRTQPGSTSVDFALPWGGSRPSPSLCTRGRRGIALEIWGGGGGGFGCGTGSGFHLEACRGELGGDVCRRAGPAAGNARRRFRRRILVITFAATLCGADSCDHGAVGPRRSPFCGSFWPCRTGSRTSDTGRAASSAIPPRPPRQMR